MPSKTSKSGSSGSSRSRSTSATAKRGATTAKKSVGRTTAAKSTGRTAIAKRTSASAKKGTAARGTAAKKTAARGSAAKSTARKSAAGGRSKPAAAKRAGAQSGSQTLSQTTIDHDEIRKWAEERGAKPARVSGTGGEGDVGMIRLDFPGFTGEGSLEEISWEEFFDAFEENQLALVYQETTAEGQRSNFNKLVGREGQQKRREAKG